MPHGRFRLIDWFRHFTTRPLPEAPNPFSRASAEEEIRAKLAEARQGVESAVASEPGHRKRVLVVDDEPVIAHTYARFAVMNGCDAVSAVLG